jgi:hypothetical protein
VGFGEIPCYETMPLSVKIALGLVRSNRFGGFLVKRMTMFIACENAARLGE